MPSGDLNKHFVNLLVTKNDLSILRNYYTGIKDEIVSDLSELYTEILTDKTLLESINSAVNAEGTQTSTMANDFIKNTTGDLIVNHEKYAELMGTYSSYIKTFYDRMTSLMDTYQSDFYKNEISDVSSVWKFHYSDRYQDASCVEHQFGALNITKDSEIFEISANRYVYRTNENVVYDVNYKTKDVYIATLDSHIFDAKNEQATFIKLFSARGLNKIYAFVAVGEATAPNGSVVIGENNANKSISSLFCYYDSIEHKFKSLSESYVSKSALPTAGSKWIISEDSYDSTYVYIAIGRHIYTVNTVTGEISHTLFSFNSSITSIAIFKTLCFVVCGGTSYYTATIPTSSGAGISKGVVSSSFTERSVANAGEDNLANYYKIFVSSSYRGNNEEAIFFAGIESSYSIVKRIVIEGSVFSESNKQTDERSSDDRAMFTRTTLENDEFLIDELGTFIYMTENKTNIVSKSFKNENNNDITTINMPTKYAERLVNLTSLEESNLEGYVYLVDREIYNLDNQTATSTENSFAFINVNDNNESKYYVITKNGYIFDVNVKDNAISELYKVNNVIWSITGDSEITCVYENGNNLLIAVNNKILKISKSDIISKNLGVNAVENLLPNGIGLGSTITAMIVIGSVLYFGTSDGTIYAVSNENGEFTLHSPVPTHTNYYNENDLEVYFIDNKQVLNNKGITNFTTDGSNFIVMGEQGKVGSCSMVTHVWTRCDGIPYGKNSTGIRESVIYNDGTCFGSGSGEKITAFINYANSRLIVFSNKAKIASCNLSTGNWTLHNGKTEIHASSGIGTGPGIYNDGSILNNLAEMSMSSNSEGIAGVTSVCRSGTTVYVCGKGGRFGSINLETTGITCYNGTMPENQTIGGPGFFYTGDVIGNIPSITTCVVDPVNAIVILGTTSGVIVSYSPSINEVLLPTSTKLYFIGRAGRDFDYLSSLMVRLTKPDIAEKTVIYPPYEDESEVFIPSYTSANYTYRNGKNLWRIGNQLDAVTVSKDGGDTNKTFATDNKNFAETSTSIRSNPMGIVSNDGDCLFAVNISEATRLLVCSGTSASWYDLENSISDTELLTISVLEFSEKKWVYTSDEGEVTELYLDGSIFRSRALFNKSVKLYGVSNYKLYGICNIDGTDYVVSIDSNGALSTWFKTSDLTETMILNLFGEKYTDIDIKGIYVSKDKIVNFILTGKEESKSVIITVSLAFKNIENGYIEDNVELTYTISTVDNALPIYGRNGSSDPYSWNTLTFDSVKVYKNNSGEKGFIVCSLTNTGNALSKSKKYTAIFAIETNVFGNTVSNENKLVYFKNNPIRVFAFDKTNVKLYAASYTELDSNGRIQNVDSIHTFKAIDSVLYSPIRPLTNVWKETQFSLGGTSGSSTNAYDSLAIHVKLRNVKKDDNEFIDKMESLRYQVLITDVTKGNFILFETEKGYNISNLDNDSKLINPHFKVIACDGFEDSIFDLYTSRLDDANRQVYENGTKESSVPDYSLDFVTFVQLKDKTTTRIYQVKIRPVNSLSETTDAEFYITPYTYSASSAAIKYKVDNFGNKSEFASVSDAEFKFGGSAFSQFLRETPIDEANALNENINVNSDYKPQFDKAAVSKIGINADTFIVMLKGNGTGLYDKISGILTKNTDESATTWAFSPYSVDKKDVIKSFDKTSSESIDKTLLSKNTRGIHNMRNFSVFPKGIINDADYQIDYEGKGRIVNVEGQFVNSKGLHEEISSLDGIQKRVGLITETKENGVYQTERGTLDSIKVRRSATSFDIIDRYNLNEDPYFAINAWWAQYKVQLQKGNERYLKINDDSTLSKLVAKKIKSNDDLEVTTTEAITETSSSIANPEENGITSAINGKYTERTDIVVTKELIWEKFPFESVPGFEGLELCFIRKYKLTYINDSIDYAYEIEYPINYENIKTTVGSNVIYQSDREQTITAIKARYSGNKYVNSSIYSEIVETLYSIPTPDVLASCVAKVNHTIPRGLYSYKVTNENWEGEGTIEAFKFATGYYYISHDWLIYKLESDDISYSSQITSDEHRNDGDRSYIYENDNNFRHDITSYASTYGGSHGSASSSPTISYLWYCPKTKRDIDDGTIFFSETNSLLFENTPIVYGSNLSTATPADSSVVVESDVVTGYNGNFSSYPLIAGTIIGKKIQAIYVPTIEALALAEVKPNYITNEPLNVNSWKNSDHDSLESIGSEGSFKLYRAGLGAIVTENNVQKVNPSYSVEFNNSQIGSSPKVHVNLSAIKNHQNFTALDATTVEPQNSTGYKNVQFGVDTSESAGNITDTTEYSAKVIANSITKSGKKTNLLTSDWSHKYGQTFDYPYPVRELLYVTKGSDVFKFFSDDADNTITVAVTFVSFTAETVLSASSLYHGINVGFTQGEVKATFANGSWALSGTNGVNLSVSTLSNVEDLGFIGGATSGIEREMLKREKITISCNDTDTSGVTPVTVTKDFWRYKAVALKDDIDGGTVSPVANAGTTFLTLDANESVGLPPAFSGLTSDDTIDSAFAKMKAEPYESGLQDDLEIDSTDNFANIEKNGITYQATAGSGTTSSNLMRAVKKHSIFDYKGNCTGSYSEKTVKCRYAWYEIASLVDGSDGSDDEYDGAQAVNGVPTADTGAAGVFFVTNTSGLSDLNSSEAYDRMKIRVRKCFEWADGTVVKEPVTITNGNVTNDALTLNEFIDYINVTCDVRVNVTVTATPTTRTVEVNGTAYYATVYRLTISAPNIIRHDVATTESNYKNNVGSFKYDASSNDTYETTSTVWAVYATDPNSGSGNNVVTWGTTESDSAGTGFDGGVISYATVKINIVENESGVASTTSTEQVLRGNKYLKSFTTEGEGSDNLPSRGTYNISSVISNSVEATSSALNAGLTLSNTVKAQLGYLVNTGIAAASITSLIAGNSAVSTEDAKYANKLGYIINNGNTIVSGNTMIAAGESVTLYAIYSDLDSLNVVVPAPLITALNDNGEMVITITKQ